MKLIIESWRQFLEQNCDDEEVKNLATFAHQGQTRRSGEPYITHPAAAAEFAKQFGYSDIIIDAAYLHDALEDYKDPAEMAEMINDVCPEALPIVKELTHDKSIEYTSYVLSLSPEAIAVKMLDMYHNAQDLQPGDKQYQKYQTALQSLQDASGGMPPGINGAHWSALTKQLGVSEV